MKQDITSVINDKYRNNDAANLLMANNSMLHNKKNPGLIDYSENTGKKCVHRTETGYCRHSNRQCALFIF
jgi:hypothetical protein